ncbi:DUF1799 domain-containing protein [Xylophilus sp. Leaf220]|uniref:DUF1799 domain-containing protein n=1 Tax=Xylophilus sp. Leaf220 TaxID=1735686 RepID=UPI0014440E66|nr:DUF1799 domain-containing protein [Xylophilus sp. Leaf220]
MGASAEDIEAVEAQVQPEDDSHEHFGLYAENVQTFERFHALRTQWRHAGIGAVRTGFDYAAIHAWMQFSVPKKERQQLFSDLQLMESAVLDADSELIKNKKET